MKLRILASPSTSKFGPIGITGVPANEGTYGILMFNQKVGETLDWSDDLISSGSLNHGDRPVRHIRFLEHDATAFPSCARYYPLSNVIVGQGRYPDPIQISMLRIKCITPKGSKTEIAHSGPLWFADAMCPDFEETYPTTENFRYRNTYTLRCGAISQSIAWYQVQYIEYDKNTGLTRNRFYPYTRVERHENGFQYRVSLDNKPWGSWQSVPYRFDLSGVPPVTKVNSLPKSWNDYYLLKRSFPTVLMHDEETFGDLVRRCANNARTISSNMLENVREIANIAKTLREIRNLAKGKLDLKKLSSGYLMAKYGPYLTYRDLSAASDDIFERLGREAREVSFSRARETVQIRKDILGMPVILDVVYNYKIYYKTYPAIFTGFSTFLNDAGLAPSLKNLWDLVPFSFVVDWMTQTSAYFDSVDANAYWRKHDIVGVTYSKKSFYRDVDLDYFYHGLNFASPVTLCEYERVTEDYPHHSVYFENTPRIFNNYVELAALIVRNRT